MLKKLLILSAFALSAIVAFATDPVKYLPSEAGLIIYADGIRVANEVAKLDTSKFNAETKENFDKFNAVLAKHSVSLQQIFNGPVFLTFCDDDNLGWIFSTSIPPESMEKLVTDLLTLFPKPFKKQIVRSGKHVIYTFQREEKGYDKLACFTYLANDVVLLFPMDADDVDEFEKDFKKLGGSPLADKLDYTQFVSVYCDVRKLEDDPKKIEQAGFDKVAVSCNLVGPNQKDVDLSAHFACLNQEKLQQLGMQVNMMVPMMLGMVFGNDPSISGDLVKTLSVTAEGTMLNLSLKVPEELCKRIETYCANPDNFKSPQTPGAAPSGAAAPATPAAN